MFVACCRDIYADGMKKIWKLLKYLLIIILCVPAISVGAEDGMEIVAAPDLIISAINAGYTGEDGTQQNYDFIELFNTTGEPLRLERYSLVYTNNSGNRTVHNFPTGLILNTEFLMMGLASAPQFSEAESEYQYRFNLAATAGMVSLLMDDVVVDEVCWGTVTCDERYARFMTGVTNNLTLARCMMGGTFRLCENGRTFEFREYYPEINFGALIYDTPEEGEGSTNLLSCKGVIFSEIFTYFEFDYAEQFVELFNPTDEIVPMNDCVIRYRNRNYPINGELQPGEYLAYRHDDLRLTKNPTSSNTIALIDGDGTEITSLTYYRGQRKLVAYAFFGVAEDGSDIWKQTHAITPGEENVYQEFRSCPEGRVINPRTGNCINVVSTELPPCPAGQFRNPETNRCRSYESIARILAPCQEGYYRNPETNRCRRIATVSASLTPCREGYERNPETNRCRKIRENAGTDYGVEPITYTDTSTFVAYGALIAVVAGGVLYVVLQFRHEIGRFIRKRFSKHGKMKL
jgi:hypothetical protein